jgi:hypothetical protein
LSLSACCISACHASVACCKLCSALSNLLLIASTTRNLVSVASLWRHAEAVPQEAGAQSLLHRVWQSCSNNGSEHILGLGPFVFVWTVSHASAPPTRFTADMGAAKFRRITG